MRKIYSTLLALLIISNTSMAQKEGLNSISKNDLKAHMSFFASDEMEGRETGTKANNAAALYIKTNLMRIGVNPIPGTGDYFQMIPLVSRKLSADGTFMSVNHINGETGFSTDSVLFLMPPVDTTDVTGEVVFAGYGHNDANTGYNDFEGISLKEKVVLIMTGNPESTDQEEGSLPFNQELENPKFGTIFSQGPKAVLYTFNPKNVYKSVYDSGLAELISGGKPGTTGISAKAQQQFSLPFPIVFVTQSTADVLLQTSGYNLRQMEDRILSGGKPVSTAIDGTTASIKALVKTSDIYCPNVIGIIEGSDPILKNECVLYSAHFDHVGLNSNGEVLNGADDNASGSMGLLEIAEAFMKLKKKPSRSIVFAWVNGEEKGLLGSHYYADHPVFPMKNTVLNINFDMIGRSKMPADTVKFMGYDLDVTQAGEVMAFTFHENTEFDKMMLGSARQSGIKVLEAGTEIPFGSSDHESFTSKGVPAFLFHSGSHADLHGAGDDVDKIDFEKMERVSKMAFLLGYKVANQ